MGFKRIVAFIQVAAIVTIAVLWVSVLPVAAVGNQSNQDRNQPATLIAPEPDFKVGVYAKPGKSQQRIGFGMGGDAVTVLEQVGSNEGYTWDHVRFDRSPYLEGWIREDFVAIQQTDRLNQFSSTQTNAQDDQKSSYSQSNPYRFEQNSYSQSQNIQRQNHQR